MTARIVWMKARCGARVGQPLPAPEQLLDETVGLDADAAELMTELTHELVGRRRQEGGEHVLGSRAG